MFSENHLEVLRMDLRKANKRAYAVGSRRNLRVQWESFLLFCLFFKFCSLPTSTETLQLYAQFLSRSFKSVDSIKNYISGVRSVHLLLGYNIEHINNFLLNLSLKGIAKSIPHIVKQAEPITPDILMSIHSFLDFSSIDNYTFWCLFLFAFFLMARKSNLVPTSSKDLSEPKFLLRKDVSFDDSTLLVSMKWTKTIQAGERILITPLSPIIGSVLCPVEAYKNMINHIPASNHSPLFVLKSSKPVTYYKFLLKLRSVIEGIGLDSKLYSTHSFRRGFATLAFRLEIPPDLIQLMGDWRSDAYKRYIQYDIKDKIKVSRFVSKNLLSYKGKV